MGSIAADAEKPAWLADPLGTVVDLVTKVEPALERARIEEVVAGVAAGRAKRRRLAHTLVDNPRLLVDGRSPAPRVTGDLLVALRRAGAVAVSPPVCAECGKLLASMQRRGQDWFCGVCGPVPERCTGCGNMRPASSRDRDGRPRCVACPPDAGRDPVEVIVEVVTAVDPSLPAEVVVAAAHGAASARPTTSARLGARGPARAAHRCGGGGSRPVGAPLDRQAVRRGRHPHRPSAVPDMRLDHRVGQAPRWAASVPQLRGQVARRAVRPLRSGSRARHPRRAGPAPVPVLLDHRPGQPGSLHRLRSPLAGQCSHPPTARSVRPAGLRRP